jgi:putative hemolysin
MTSEILRDGFHPTPATTATPAEGERTLVDLAEGRYRVRLARDAEELAALQRLRFEVFNRELGEGLASAWQSGRDEDAFDAGCDHLLVEEAPSGALVGTYRLQTAAMAARHRGFYSAGEFDLGPLPAEVLDTAVEVGRACVARAHRNTRVLFLLWRGLARYVASHGLRYLFGCASVTSQDPAVGMALYRRLAEEGRLHPTVWVPPLAALACDGGEPTRSGRGLAPPLRPELERASSDSVVELPPLFRIYLRHGAWICGPPAIDREFGTLDFFVLFDVDAMDPARFRAFFG